MKTKILFFILFIFSFTINAQEIKLPHLYTYIKSPVVEQQQVLTAEEIVEMHVADLPQLMVAAGVQILSYGPYGLEQKPSIRGFTDETVRVIVDGICVNNAQYGTFDFSTINIEDIERIEIIRGGFTEGVSDEGAVGGAIYITTKKQGLGQHFFFNSQIKTYFNYFQPMDTFSQWAGFSGQLSDLDYLKMNFKGVVAANKYLFQNFKGFIKERENAEVLDGNGSVNFLHYFGDGNSFAINDLFYAGKKNTPGSEKSENYGLQKDFDNNFSMQLVLPEVANLFRMENSISWLSNTRFYEDFSSSSDSSHYVNSFKYFGNVDFNRNKFVENSTGLTFDFTHLDSTDDGVHNQFSGTLKNTFKIKRFCEGSDGFPFVMSVPVAFTFCNENFAFVPKVGFGLKGNVLDVYLNGYKMIQFPNMDDLYWNDGRNFGNPDLKPENGYGAELCVNIHGGEPGGRFSFVPISISIFTNYYENKIQWANVNGAWMPENVASAFYFGVDGKFESVLLNGMLIIKGNGEYLYTKLMDKSSINFGKKIMWTPDFVGTLSGTLVVPKSERFSGVKLSLDANYVGKRYCSNLNISFMKPYMLLNLVAESDFVSGSGKWNFVPYIRIDNLLNVHYEAVENYPMPGISLSLGCRISC